MAHNTPTLTLVTLPSANTAYQLSALLAAIDPDIIGSLQKGRCQYLQLQFDPSAGADLLYIGNSGVSPTNYGVVLVATQAWPVQSLDNNLIRADQIWLYSTGASHVVAVAMLTR